MDPHSLWFIVEIAKALAWPFVALAALVGFFLLRRSLPKLGDMLRNRSLTLKLPGGVGATALAEQSQQAAGTSPIAHGPSGELRIAIPPSEARVSGTGAATESADTVTAHGWVGDEHSGKTVRDLGPARHAVALVEDGIRKTLEQIPANEREERLIRGYATAIVQATHEFIYSRIFGSQIEALKQLDLRGPMGASLEEAQQYFRDQVVKLHPEFYSGYGFDGWLGFLVFNNLVAKDEKSGRLTVTPYGHDFLVYLREQRMNETKPW